MSEDNTQECVMCGQEIEKDWADSPPHPRCYGCNQAHESAMDDTEF